MQLNVFPRNNDFGASVQTFQERVNGMLPVENDIRVASSAAEAYSMPRRPDPHYLTSSEVEQVLTMVEKEAQEQNEALLRIHSGLNRDRVQRLLELLR
ncbi:MAG: pseudouridine synthase [Desulfovibrio sp.]|nr:pseudouridine synthase [Desulfovibrio sp.]